MKKTAAILLALCAFGGALAQNFTEWQDTKVNQINRAPMRSSFFAYENEKAALAGVKENSENFMSLNGKWKFMWVKDASDRPTDFFKADYNVMPWGEISVPAIWERNGYGDAVYINPGYAWSSVARTKPNDSPSEKSKINSKVSMLGPVASSSSGQPGENNFQVPEAQTTGVPTTENHVGSYVRQVYVPAGWSGKEVYIHFGSVTSNIYLWVNGKFVGYSEDSKLGAEFDLTPFLKAGENRIAFQVFRWSDGSWLEDQDFFRLSGVAREVYMYARPTVHLNDLFITTDLDAEYKNADVNIAASIAGAGSSVKFQLLDGGKEVASATAKAAKNGDVKVTMPLTAPSQWTAETPNLYTLVSTVYNAKGEPTEVVPQKVGVREIEIRNSQVLINGKPVLFKGADRHEIDPDGGYLISRERMEQDVRLFKELNLNAVRTSHYPNDPYFYELCDKYGLYMVDEANIEAHGMGYGPENLGSDVRFDKAHLERTSRMQLRDKNHPSVIFWSMGNESGDGANFRAAYKAMKAFDTTRPVQYERALWDKNGNDYSDIWCPMYTRYAELEMLGNLKGEGSRRVNGYHKEGEGAPRPVILCEYAHAMGNSMGGFKEYWDIIRKYPNVQGAFIWDFVDQSQRDYRNGKMIYTYGGDYGRYTVDDYNFCSNGLVSPDRRRNPHADEVAYVQQNIWATPVDLQKGVIEVYNENFFIDLSNYALDWELVHRGVVIERGVVANLDVEPGKRAQVVLPYTLPCKDCGKKECVGEMLLNVNFTLKKADGLLPAGFRTAYEQMVIAPFKGFKTAVTPDKGWFAIRPNTRAIMVEGEDFHVYVSRSTGLITDYTVGGKSMLEAGFSIRPTFWRAGTDNDFGANLNNSMRAWLNPQMRTKEVRAEADGGFIVVTSTIELPKHFATLTLQYTINAKGEIGVSEKLVTDPAQKNMPYLFRFGMEITMPGVYDHISFYGRGPGESYSDRKNGAKLGVYNQSVADQYYPYIRPQESGNKTDLRWFKVSALTRRGLEFRSNGVFQASALPYLTEDLDGGTNKDGHEHSGELVARNLTNIHIDGVQSGLACEDSWGAVPRPEYRLPYGDYSFDFFITPLGL
ncbi:MAG: glycoside hydrolase family 2 TIM barrel-domain containing protein [Mucinivorans sp.]